jgi:two-component system chemotaxis sensor kinase CheA
LSPGGGEDELVQLLFKGGLSTSSAVTELAGRGVGLNLVREVVERLGGEVAVSTQAGRGARIELIVPISLLAMDVLLAQAGGGICAIPLASVRETLRVATAQVVRSAEGDTLVHGGEAKPFIPLARLLKRTDRPLEDGETVSAVVVGGAQGEAVVAVERLLGAANVLVHPLPPLTFADPVVVGACLDAQGAPQPVLEPDRLLAEARRMPGATPAAPRQRAPILVIDDSLTTRVLEQSILESAGYEVELATSAEEALEKARRRAYALFMVDVEMPGMDGFSFVEATRADPELRKTPAILVTSRASAADRERGRQAGAHAHIEKGAFNQGEVLEIIRRLLE